MLIGNYKTLLKTFIEHKYYFVDFSSIDMNKNSQVILRHDIDLDIDIALEMACNIPGHYESGMVGPIIIE